MLFISILHGFESCKLLTVLSVSHLQYSNASIKKSTTNIATSRGAPRALIPLNVFFLALCRLRCSVMKNDQLLTALVFHSLPYVEFYTHGSLLTFDEFMPKVFEDPYPTNLYYQQRMTCV